MICTYYTECLLKIMKANSKIVTLCNRENWRKKCPSVKFSVAASSSLYQFQTHQLSHHKRDEVLAARKWFHHRNRKMFQRSDTVWKIQNFAITNFLHKNSVNQIKGVSNRLHTIHSKYLHRFDEIFFFPHCECIISRMIQRSSYWKVQHQRSS